MDEGLILTRESTWKTDLVGFSLILLSLEETLGN